MQELIKALIKAKAEFNPIQKDGTNPHFKHKYATLDAVLDAVTPGLSKWLHSRNVTSPSELDSLQIDELIKTMCLAWAGNKFGHPNHAINSYQKQVIDAVLRGVSEMEAIQAWMEGALAQLPELN
ncbi:ERF family protein [Nostoc flagelliforme FACHB-838]|uniref:ERF family protein n=1 Tax=Nostoc flagelliforme FACHB-838 TaxID=2692904 RepID=A0ABR8E433_9NOSO|nr:ERF family protein [Nostoc flagelliforme]MBD2535827.1 ERF family protein [Nostoc flagelliforme FACHB-838]